LLQQVQARPLPQTSDAFTPASSVNGGDVQQSLPNSYEDAYASPLSSTTTNDEISSLEAEECLEMFRRQKLKYFQFVHIPPSMTAAQLHEEKPLLWLIILAINAKSSSRQYALGSRFQSLIAQKVVKESLRSMDILLSLLGFLGWSTYFFGQRPFMAVYCHLTIAVLQDLGIDKPPGKPNDIHPMACIKQHGFVAKMPPSIVRTMEERRALLACYLVSSMFVTITVRSSTLC
jgi:hypothetical protein